MICAILQPHTGLNAAFSGGQTSINL